MNYGIPVDFKSLYTGQKLQQISASRSVVWHVYLMLMTSYGEYGFNNLYGCKLWQNDFDLGIITGNWTQEIESSLSRTISDNEPRLSSDFSVKVLIEKINGEDAKNQKKKFSVTLSNMRLVATNEKIEDVDFSIVFSPISIE